jgi:hypothetical protein
MIDTAKFTLITSSATTSNVSTSTKFGSGGGGTVLALGLGVAHFSINLIVTIQPSYATQRY